MTAYANECDTSGSLSFLAGDWYSSLVPSGILGCSSGGGGGGDVSEYGPPDDTTTGGDTGGDTGGSSGGSSGGSDGGDKCKDSNYTYAGKIKKDGKWTCKSGYEQSGCSDKKLQCRKKKTEASKCKPGTRSNYDYRRRIEHPTKKWICPNGWESTGCGWSDGAELGELQCRKRKKAGGSSSTSTSSTSTSSLKIKLVDDPSKRDTATYEVGVGDYPDLRQDLDKKWNDRITGFDIPKGLRVIGYRHPQFGGEPITLDGTDTKDSRGYNITHWLSTDNDWKNGQKMWDEISSLKVSVIDSSGSAGSSSGTSSGSNVYSYTEAKKKTKCNAGSSSKYKFQVRKWHTGKNMWLCPSGFTDTKCGIIKYKAKDGSEKYIDPSPQNQRQCQKKK